MASISGVVTNANGVAVGGITVRAYRRDTGALLGSSVSGSAPIAARYIRFRQITSSDYFDISELQVFEGGTQRVGTISATSAPFLGSLENLTNGLLTERAAWYSNTASAADFAVVFDFGAGNSYAIDGFKQGGFDAAGRQIQSATVEYSQDGAQWYLLKTLSGLAYPGNNTLSNLIPLTSGLALGQYLIDCGSYTGEVQRIALADDVGTLYNDLIDRVMLS